MKLFEITSGFIAAVLVALGAYQYVNNAKVGEEPVVREEVTTQTESVIKTLKSNIKRNNTWRFNGSSSASPTEATNYLIGGNPTCSSPAQTVCEISAPEKGSTGYPDMDALVELPGGGFATVESRINDALTPPLSTNETVTSLRSH